MNQVACPVCGGSGDLERNFNFSGEHSECPACLGSGNAGDFYMLKLLGVHGRGDEDVYNCLCDWRERHRNFLVCFCCMKVIEVKE